MLRTTNQVMYLGLGHTFSLAFSHHLSARDIGIHCENASKGVRVVAWCGGDTEGVMIVALWRGDKGVRVVAL